VLFEDRSRAESFGAIAERYVLAAVGEAIDAVGGSFEMSYDALLVRARRA
jgi:hypothetical protein